MSSDGGLLSAARRRLVRNQRSARKLITTLTSPLPSVELELRAWVPGWVLRVVLAALGAAVIVVLAPPGPVLVIMIGFLIAVFIRPGARTGSLFCLVTAVIWLIVPDPPLSVATPLLLALVPAVPALGSAIEPMPLTVRIEWRALRPSLLRYLIIQLVSQPVVLAAAALEQQGLSLLPVAIAGAAAVALAIWLVLPRLSQ